MSSPGSKRKKRSRGYGLTIVVILVFLTVAAVLIYQPIWRTKQTEQKLNDRYGDTVAFIPAADGSIPQQRLEAFLRVREKVIAHCPEMLEKVHDLYHLDELEQDTDASNADVAREGVSGFKKLFSFFPAFLRFVEARNHALLEEEMGLGEYIYIYIVAYAEQLSHVDESKFAGIEQAYVGDRARKELSQILENQLDELMSGDTRSANVNLAAGLQDQIAALSDGRQTLPWLNELPPSIAASLEPYSQRLDQYYCEGIAKIELMQKNKGLNIKN